MAALAFLGSTSLLGGQDALAENKRYFRDNDALRDDTRFLIVGERERESGLCGKLAVMRNNKMMIRRERH